MGTERLNELRLEIGIYVATHPHAFSVQQDGDVVTAGGPIIKVDPPADIGLIFGDCMNAIRAPLDYIAWELVQKYSAVKLTPGQEKSILFPIAETPAKCQDRLAQLTTFSVPKAAADLIESVQPYHAGYEPLATLNRLVNIDKHRLPLLTFAKVDTHFGRAFGHWQATRSRHMQHPNSGAILMGKKKKRQMFS